MYSTDELFNWKAKDLTRSLTAKHKSQGYSTTSSPNKRIKLGSLVHDFIQKKKIENLSPSPIVHPNAAQLARSAALWLTASTACHGHSVKLSIQCHSIARRRIYVVSSLGYHVHLTFPHALDLLLYPAKHGEDIPREGSY